MTKPKPRKRTRVHKLAGVDGRVRSPKFITMGAHRFDPEVGRCTYCGATREMIDDGDLPRCVKRNWRAAERMAQRTPLRLTSQDEDILREDWGLSPNNLRNVRIYQELTRQMRGKDELNGRLQTALERIKELEEEIIDEHGHLPLGKGDGFRVVKEAAPAKIRRMSRPQNVWPPSLAPTEVLLMTETVNGVEYAFIAADQIAADWAMSAMPRAPDLWFEWMMKQSIAKEQAP